MTWKTEELNKNINFIDYRGKTPNKIEKGMRLITAKNAKMGFLQLNPQEFVDPENYDLWMTRGIPKFGDVLFTTEAPLANVCQLDTTEKVVIGQRLITMQPNESLINSTFLKYSLLSPQMQNEIHSHATGATVLGIKSKLLKKIPFSYPSLPEQERIVEILDQVFADIEKARANAEQNLKNARELFDSYLQKVFSEKSEGWEEKKLSEICSKITDGVHKKPNYQDKGVPFLKIHNLTKGSGISLENLSYISEEDHKEFCKRTHPEKGDILITKDGTIGIVRIIDFDIDFSIFVSLALVKPIDKTISPYLKYVLESPLIQNQINPQGAALKHLYLRDLRAFTIPIPSIEIQKEIVFKLDSMSQHYFKLESIYTKKIAALDELKKSILQKAFSGELTKEEFSA
ncbi:MAG: restriction endonuclease subunit S [Lentisphaeraceae bacterium]|nr:restriction endonuclease subunit S [Lentisphaeraceae bacterium]